VVRLESPNRRTLQVVAARIKPLLPRLVFVGGQVGEFYITDPAAVRIRATKDVDVIVRVASKVEYHRVEEELRGLDFRNDTSDGGVICRWISPEGHKLDLMPIDPGILGFSNRWYRFAVENTVSQELAEGLTISIPTAPAFFATKLEAFRERGQADLLGSPDLEDLIVLTAGRPQLVDEMRRIPAEVGEWVATALGELLEEVGLRYAIEGALPDAALLPQYTDQILVRMEKLTNAGSEG